MNLASNSLCAFRAFTLKWALEDAGGPIVAKVSSNILGAQLRSCPGRVRVFPAGCLRWSWQGPAVSAQRGGWVGWLVGVGWFSIFFFSLLLVFSLSDPERALQLAASLPFFFPPPPPAQLPAFLTGNETQTPSETSSGFYKAPLPPTAFVREQQLLQLCP